MLFCNFLRINLQLVVQKLIGPQIHHFIVRDAIFFAGGANTVPNSEKKCNRQFKHRAAVNKLFEMATLTEDTAQDFWDLGKNTFSFSGFSYAVHGLRRKSRTCCMCIFGCRIEVAYY